MRHKPTLDAANEVVEESKGIRKLDGRSARAVLTAWMRAMGWERDRYNNWFPDRSHDKRYHFSKRMFQYQDKFVGRWGNIESVSLLDAATRVILASGEESGRQAEVARFAKKAATRQKSRARAAGRRADDELRSQARRVAVERVMHQHWELAYHYGVLQEKGAPLLSEIRDVLMPQADKLGDELFGKLKSGRRIASPRYSVQDPPTTLFFKDFDTSWTEAIGGTRYTVRIKNRSKTEAHVHIGKSGKSGLVIDPTMMAVDMDSSGAKAEGDAYISGSINLYQGNPFGRLFLIVAHEGRKRAGSRALTLWCDMMDGYAIERWIAEAVGKEGMAFFKSLDRKGKIRIYGSKGSNLGIECVSMHPNPKLLGFVTA
jgi:hypothetical protein